MANNMKIKYAMLKYGVNQEQLARKLGVDQSTVSRKLNKSQLKPDESREIMELITSPEEGQCKETQ